MTDVPKNLRTIDSYVDPREIWKKEAKDFSPWLERNIQEISKALKLSNIEVIERESYCGDFRLDLLAKTKDGSVIAIESQLEKTDAKHLGQLMVYGAHTEADIVIWITTFFRPEFLRVVDDLNRQMKSRKFAAILLKGIKIGDSIYPIFNVVAGEEYIQAEAEAEGQIEELNKPLSEEPVQKDPRRSRYWFLDAIRNDPKTTEEIRQNMIQHGYEVTFSSTKSTLLGRDKRPDRFEVNPPHITESEDGIISITPEGKKYLQKTDDEAKNRGFI